MADSQQNQYVYGIVGRLSIFRLMVGSFSTCLCPEVGRCKIAYERYQWTIVCGLGGIIIASFFGRSTPGHGML